jgi:hypothetical protein
MNGKLISEFKKLGLELGETISQKDYSAIIEAIKVKFAKKLGENLDKAL